MASDVNWSYLKGMPVFIGVVNRLERVMTITCGFPRANFTYKNASAPAPPALLTTRKFWGARLFFWRTAEMKRAIRSAPPPVPAGTTNSTGFVGCHPGAPAAGKTATSATPSHTTTDDLNHLIMRWTTSVRLPADSLTNSSGLLLRVARRRQARVSSVALTGYAGGCSFSNSLWKGMTPGISHFSHISSTFAWK